MHVDTRQTDEYDEYGHLWECTCENRYPIEHCPIEGCSHTVAWFNHNDHRDYWKAHFKYDHLEDDTDD